MSRRLSIVFAAAAAALAGCVSVLPKAAPAQLYRFGAGAPAAEAPRAAPVAGAPAVALGSVTLPRAAAGDGLLTVTGDQAAYVAGARWVSAAAILMREAAVRVFAAHPGVRLVGAEAPAAARLDLAVTDFEVDYPARGAAPTIRVSLTATLSARAGGAVVRSVSVSRPAAENRLAAIVPAYDAAVHDALGQVAGWVDGRAATLPAG